MNVLITGANGFIGKNLIDRFRRMPEITVLPYHHTDSEALLKDYCQKADFVFHFASVCRPKDPSEFLAGNYGSLKLVLDTLEACQNTCPVLFTSSIQAAMAGRFANSEYGRTKRMAEDLLMTYGDRTGARVMYYRLPHLFGKWGMPNYNNVVHTFCYNIAHGIFVQVSKPETELEVLWIEDLLDMLSSMMHGKECGMLLVEDTYNITVETLAKTLQDFESGAVLPKSEFEQKLYLTYLHYK